MRSTPIHWPGRFPVQAWLLALVGLALTVLTSATTVAAPPLQTVPTIEFRDTSVTVSEASGQVTLVVEATGVTTSAAVQFFTQDGTATSGSDYTAESGTLSFSASNLTRNITVDLRNDGTAEDTESFLVSLHSPVGAVIDPDRQTAVVIINDDDSQTTPTPIFVDRYEPNNTLAEAYTMVADGPPLDSISLWPVGDVDWFRFNVKAASAYEALTRDLSTGLDTVLTVYNAQGQEIGSNDDYQLGSRASRVIFSANVDGLYYAKITNKSPTDPANLTYRFDVNEIQPTATPTGLPTSTRVPGADGCEYNNDFDSACVIGVGQTLDLNFVPLFGEQKDNDFFRMWVKPGITYTCETFDLSGVNDTNLILYDQNRNGIGGNDDKAIGDLGSRLSWRSTYTGWLYILVGPHEVASYADSFLYTYSLRCTQEVLPTPTNTRPPFTGGGFVATRPPTPTPITEGTPTPTTSGEGAVLNTPTPTATPNVQFQPLPTSTPQTAVVQAIDLDVVVYFDENRNFNAELAEGVEDVAVAIYDNATGDLLAFGYTNEAGSVAFGPLEVSGAVRVSIPFLRYTQIVAGSTALAIRVAPPVTSP
ncbi:MAG: Calx-beta domain-containing protein [Candidatus Promineifilaceae bacterium]|nr:Calx-beta domain-containing protein [Candidatus Promineifilaceae bacterium]